MNEQKNCFYINPGTAYVVLFPFQIFKKCCQSVVRNVLQRDFNLDIYKIKKPILFDRLCLYGGERGIRTPVPVFAGNMISNHAP